MSKIEKSVLDEKHLSGKITFSSFESGSGSLPMQSKYNCDCRGGTLKEGMQFSYLLDEENEVVCNMSVTCKNVFVLRTNTGSSTSDGVEYILVGSDGYIYKLNQTTNAVVKKFSIGQNVTYNIFRDQTRKLFNLLGSTTKVMYTTTGDTGVSMATGGMNGFCLAGSRTFIGSRAGKIVYSEPFVPYRFSGDIHQGGEFYVPADVGEIITLQADKENVYVFAEKGICRLRVSAEAIDLRLERLDYDGGAVCPNGAVLTKNGIFLLAAGGVYCLRGNKIQKVCKELIITPDVSQACTFGLCEDMVVFEYSEKQANGNSLLKRVAIYTDGEYGFFTEVHSFLGNSPYSKLDDKLTVLTRNKANGMVLKPSYYLSKPLDFGVKKCKTLKRLVARGQGEVKIVVMTGGVSHEYTLAFVDGFAQTRLYERGKEISFCLYPSGGSEILDFSVEYVYAEK